MSVVIYRGQPTRNKAKMLVSHYRRLDEQGLLIEYGTELPNKEWRGLHILFPHDIVVAMLPQKKIAKTTTQRDGVYLSDRDGVFDVVSDGLQSKYSAKQAARVLFKAMH